MASSQSLAPASGPVLSVFVGARVNVRAKPPVPDFHTHACTHNKRSSESVNLFPLEGQIQSKTADVQFIKEERASSACWSEMKSKGNTDMETLAAAGTVMLVERITSRQHYAKKSTF